MTSKEKGPIQISIENKVIIYNQYSGLVTHGLFHQITEALNPTILEAINESHLHAHHAAMKGNTNKETHFK